MTALTKVRKLGARRQELQDELDQLRPELVDAIRAAAAEGMRQIDIVKATGYTREMVRRIVGGS
jgi:hypothetical protein